MCLLSGDPSASLDLRAGRACPSAVSTTPERGITLKRSKLFTLTLAAVIASAGSTVAASAASAASISGAGSTLVAPLEAEWQTNWDSSTGNSVTFSAVGSGTGMSDLASGQVNFGASDAPLSAYPNLNLSNVVQIPWALTATALGYNLPGVKSLKLSGPVLAGIYLGTITTWNNPAIKALNKGVSLPGTTITPVFRSDGSGDSFAFTSFLSGTSSTFKSRIGAGIQPSFPSPPDVGAKGNLGVTTTVQNTPGAIGYISASYLIAHSIPAAEIQNAAKKFEFPNLPEIEAAASIVKHVPSNNQVTIVNPPKKVKNAYPISTFTYAMAPLNSSVGTTLQAFFNYAISNQGQQYGPALDFAHLPNNVLKADKNTIARIQ
jgi:phosphate transport system substrate-binding protein